MTFSKLNATNFSRLFMTLGRSQLGANYSTAYSSSERNNKIDVATKQILVQLDPERDRMFSEECKREKVSSMLSDISDRKLRDTISLIKTALKKYPIKDMKLVDDITSAVNKMPSEDKCFTISFVDEIVKQNATDDMDECPNLIELVNEIAQKMLNNPKGNFQESNYFATFAVPNIQTISSPWYVFKLCTETKLGGESPVKVIKLLEKIKKSNDIFKQNKLMELIDVCKFKYSTSNDPSAENFSITSTLQEIS